METITFAAQTSQETQWLWAGILLVVLAGGGLFWSFKKKAASTRSSEKVLIQMLFFFGLLIGVGTAVFSGIGMMRLRPLLVHSTGIEYHGVRTPWSSLRQVYVVSAQDRTFLNTAGTQTRMLVIERAGHPDLFFSESSYPISEMLGVIRDKSGK